MALNKKAIFIHDDKPVHAMLIDSNQKLFRIHLQTHLVEEVELLYTVSRVDFDEMYHYTAALSSERALEKYKRWKERDDAKNKGKKQYLN